MRWNARAIWFRASSARGVPREGSTRRPSSASRGLRWPSSAFASSRARRRSTDGSKCRCVTMSGDAPEGRAGEVFGAFLKLGLTSFGGPIAHLGYFRNEFVERRRWLDEQSYADL